jgi:FixJ family two-component response regulator
MRQVLPMFRATGESQRAKIIFCGIEVDDRLQALAKQESADFIAVSYAAELAPYGSETDWGCVVAGDASVDGHALHTIARFTEAWPGFCWIVWSSKLDLPAAVGAMQLGALNVLRAHQDDESLPASLASANRLGRERFLSWRQRSDVRRRLGELSESERQVLALVLKGLTNREVALRLDFSLRTVESKRQTILRVMQAENIIVLAALLAQHGMLDQIVITTDGSNPVEPHSAIA